MLSHGEVGLADVARFANRQHRSRRAALAGRRTLELLELGHGPRGTAVGRLDVEGVLPDDGFGKAFQIGILIAVIGSLCYVATWETMFYGSNVGEKIRWPPFLQVVDAEPATKPRMMRKVAEMLKFQELYRSNPLFNVAMTLIQAFPVGLVITLVSAGVLSRKREESNRLLETVKA